MLAIKGNDTNPVIIVRKYLFLSWAAFSCQWPSIVRDALHCTQELMSVIFSTAASGIDMLYAPEIECGILAGQHKA